LADDELRSVKQEFPGYTLDPSPHANLHRFTRWSSLKVSTLAHGESENDILFEMRIDLRGDFAV
jgi:hypothetical protein